MAKHAVAARPRLSAHLVIAGVAAGAAVAAAQFEMPAPAPRVTANAALAANLS
ncbi:MAG: hypothetical protein HOV94_25640, partial [Saccharothrix sp.]|nr:hypothetical protein [Saccharothrix sp.]